MDSHCLQLLEMFEFFELSKVSYEIAMDVQSFEVGEVLKIVV